jgi:hypothetical protein
VRVSLGIASTFADAERFVAFTRTPLSWSLVAEWLSYGAQAKACATHHCDIRRA